jgi:hypothetical protein
MESIYSTMEMRASVNRANVTLRKTTNIQHGPSIENDVPPFLKTKTFDRLQINNISFSLLSLLCHVDETTSAVDLSSLFVRL